MSAFWSIFIIVIVAINIVGCVALLWYTSRRRDGGGAEDTTGHVWDEDLTEYNKPLPRWWIILFYLTILYSIGYLIYYPGMGSFEGTSGWTSQGEHDEAKAEADARMAAMFARFEGRELTALAQDEEALRHGQSVFANHCATCHGSDARGARGFPNLVDESWQWGGTPDQVLASILNGRQGVMPALGAAMGGDQGVTETVVYVQSLSGQKVDQALATAGKQRYQTLCVACHGPEGKGMAALGAPDLTDDIWLYGGDFESIRTTLVQGRNGQMPAHGPLIGEARSRLVAAWVLAQSRDRGDEDGNAP